MESSWSWKNKGIGALLGGGASIGLALLFYLNPGYVVFTWPMGLMIYYSYKTTTKKRAQLQLLRELRDSLLAVEIALRAGYALENAVYEGDKELERLWGQRSILRSYWSEMEKMMELKVPVEVAFARMSGSIGIPEIGELSQLLSAAKRSGGGIAELLKLYVDQLGDRLAVQGEIEAGLTEKRMEKNIMLVMPPAILAYLLSTSFDWISILYEGGGRVFMSVMLALYAFSWMLGEKLLDIKV